MNTPWIWLDLAVLRAAHEEQLLEHGGAAGIGDEGLLELAAARPRHLSAYGSPDIADLAAAYGYGIAKNHPFIDGNKRTALVAIETFLWLNGMELNATDADCVMTILSLAAGEMEEDALANWIRRQSTGIST